MATPKINQNRAPIGTFMTVNEEVTESVDKNIDENVNADVNKNVYVYKKKPKFEDLHERQTVYIEKAFVKKIERMAGKERGLKTKIINDALREFLSKYE